jgi:hypothetical protein
MFCFNSFRRFIVLALSLANIVLGIPSRSKMALYAAWSGPGIDLFWVEPVLIMAGYFVDIVRDVGEVLSVPHENIAQATFATVEQWQSLAGLPKQSDAPYVSGKCSMSEVSCRTMFGDVLPTTTTSGSTRNSSFSGPLTTADIRRANSADVPSWTLLLQWIALQSADSSRNAGDMQHPYRASEPLPNLLPLDFRSRSLYVGRSFFISDKGYIGTRSPDAQRGDVIFVIYGCDVPFILRKHEDQSPVTLIPDDFGCKGAKREITLDGTAYSVIGDCFVYGAMDGEFQMIRTLKFYF